MDLIQKNGVKKFDIEEGKMGLVGKIPHAV